MRSQSLPIAILLFLAGQGCMGVSLRGMGQMISRAFVRPGATQDENAGVINQEVTGVAQQPNAFLSLFGAALAAHDILDDILPTPQTPVTTCSVAELLAWSENVGTDIRGSLHVGEGLEMSCLPGFIPPPGLSNIVTVRCLKGTQGNAWWDLDSRLNCGLPCQNSELVTDLGLPVESRGVTAPQGRMEMRCKLRGMQPVYGVCQPNGQWLTDRPCQPCDTSDLLTSNMAVTLSAGGMLMPYSKIQMSCPKGMYAFPAPQVTVTCEPGGTWTTPFFDCRQHGCDTADFLPGELETEVEGLLAVGATVLVRRTDNQESGVAVTYYTSQCQENGAWASMPYNTATGDHWDSMLSDSDIQY